MILAKNITKVYGKLPVLKDISLEIGKGEIVSIVGKSGAGKSTILHIMGTLDKPTSGDIYFNGTHLNSLSDKRLSDFRNRHIGFVFQFHHLLPEFTALENVCIPSFIRGSKRTESEKKAKELLDYLGLSQRMDHKPSQLSGGEQQRVAVARALINQPAAIFADEPSGNLDTQTSKELHELFFRLRNEMNQTFVIVTHNTDLAEMADRTIYMKDGQLADKENH